MNVATMISYLNIFYLHNKLKLFRLLSSFQCALNEWQSQNEEKQEAAPA